MMMTELPGLSMILDWKAALAPLRTSDLFAIFSVIVKLSGC